MGDLINRDKFLETHGGMWSMSMYVGYASDLKAFNEGRKSVIDMLKNEEPVDAEPVKHEYWVGHLSDGWGRPEYWTCSGCQTVGSPQWKRCPVCEAKMSGGTDDAENRA